MEDEGFVIKDQWNSLMGKKKKTISLQYEFSH